MPENSIEAELELEIDATLGEGPIWDETKKVLYWVDIMSGRFFIYNPNSNNNSTFEIGEHIGAIAFREKGGLVMAIKTGFAFFDPSNKKITKIADPESHLPNNRFNDGKCGPGGRFWAGTMAYDSTEGAGSLYCLNPDLSVDLKLSNISCSNGLAWNQDQDKFFYIDTPTGNIYSFDYREGTGEISNQNVIKNIDKNDGYPDGMTIDEEDYLWIALYGGSKIIRIHPESGETVFEVHLPVPKVTSCTFGGSNLDELYITTCRENMSKAELQQAPLSGSLFKAKLACRGLPTFRFLG